MTAATQGGSVHNASRPAPSGRGHWRGMRRGMLRLNVLDTGSSHPACSPSVLSPRFGLAPAFSPTHARVGERVRQRALGGAKSALRCFGVRVAPRREGGLAVIAQHVVCERCLPQRSSRFDPAVGSPIRARSPGRSVSALRIGARSLAIVFRFLRSGFRHLRRLEWRSMSVQALPIVDSAV